MRINILETNLFRYFWPFWPFRVISLPRPVPVEEVPHRPNPVVHDVLVQALNRLARGGWGQGWSNCPMRYIALALGLREPQAVTGHPIGRACARAMGFVDVDHLIRANDHPMTNKEDVLGWFDQGIHATAPMPVDPLAAPTAV